MQTEDGFNEFMIHTGRNLRRARGNAKMTQHELARAAETSQSAVNMYERGKQCMTIWTLARLCRALGVSASDVMGEFDARNDNS